MKKYLFVCLLLLIIHLTNIESKKPKEKPEWAKKDIRDFTDVDMERLLEQWEVSTYSFIYSIKIVQKLLDFYF